MTDLDLDAEMVRRAIRAGVAEALQALDLRQIIHSAVHEAVGGALGLPGELRGRIVQASQEAVERALR